MMRIALYAIIAIVAIVLRGQVEWWMGTRWLFRKLDRSGKPIAPTQDEREQLPAPVRRYLDLAVGSDARRIAVARIEHRGTLWLDPKRKDGAPFRSRQRVACHPPGFIWDARLTSLSGMGAVVHDAYVDGEGSLEVSFGGLFGFKRRDRGSEFARGELMRWLAETAWYPTALLPGGDVTWAPHGDRSAMATVTDGATSVSLRFEFGDDGLIEGVTADARGRMVGKEVVPTPWQGRFWNYGECDGMRIPLDAEVSWILPEGPQTYYRGHLERSSYEFA